MGQKTNPNIFRLGKTKRWKSKYFEKKSSEQGIYAFKDLEIKKFISKFLEDNGLTLYNCKLYYTENALHVSISYYLTEKAIFLVNKQNKTQRIQLIAKGKIYKRRKKYQTIRKNIVNYFNYNKIIYNRKVKNFIGKKLLSNAKKTIKHEKQALKFRRMRFLQYYKKSLITKSFKNIQNIRSNSFLEQVFESLHLFTHKKLNIFLTLKQLNKDVKQTFSNKKLKILKKNIVQLRKYKQNKFFKEGINVLFTCTTRTNSADLLAKFIATNLKKLKRHNFFLKFITTTLTLFNKNIFSNLEGIKIKVKGRLNGAPRSKHKIITINRSVPVLTLNANINYSEATAFSSNGTLGVKVWTFEKTKLYKKYYV